jgi:aminopeptidase N
MDSVGKRSLKNTAFSYLSSIEDNIHLPFITAYFELANNMTDSLSMLKTLCNFKHAFTEKSLNAFYEKWKNDPLVLNNWFAVQAVADRDDVLNNVRKLWKHPSFDAKNPNNIRNLLRCFYRNLKHFHNISGEAYSFMTDCIIEIDQYNRMQATYLVPAFEMYPRLDSTRQALIKAQLERLCAPSLSKEVRGAASAILSSVKTKESPAKAA